MVCINCTVRAGSTLVRPATVLPRKLGKSCVDGPQHLIRIARIQRSAILEIDNVRPEHDDSSTTCRTASVVTSATALASITYLELFVTPSDAYAAKVCFDVPDWAAEFDPVHAVFHSPIFAVGAAALALLLFPKLIKFSINYLAVPAIACLLAWLAISYPQQTASSIYTVLEFIKEHPAASSIGVITAAGIILGPDLLAGAAVGGVVLLLAVQAGVVQLPAVQLPRLPGQQLMTRQIDKAGKAIRQKIDDLDQTDLITNVSSSSSSSSSSGGRIQLAPPPLSMVVDDPGGTAAAAAIGDVQQQRHVPAAAAAASHNPADSVEGKAMALGSQLTGKLGQAGQGVFRKITHVVTDDRDNDGMARHEVPDDSLPSRLGSKLSSSWTFSRQTLQQAGQAVTARVQQSEAMQGLKDMTQPSAAGVLAKVKQGAGALKDKVIHARSQQQQQQQSLAVVIAPKGVAAQQQQQEQQRSDVANRVGDVMGDAVADSQRGSSGRSVDSILANS